jgi:acyl-CoA reductase-like NAD-dependent aldehyde dehydrogenase
MLVTLEAGKIVSEGLGEAQEMIDICDFAVGLSRQLYGLTMPSERPGHHMRETWQPLGPVAVVTAFNFPIAVWAWNAALALVCGDPVIWKPSEKTPLTALGVQAVFERAVARFGDAPEGLAQLLIGGREVGEALSADPRVPLVSATGSTRMGKAVAQAVAGRLGRSLLELGGNNAMIVTPSADLEMAVRAIAFSAVGTAGQRCTSLRRLIVHESVAEALTARLTKAYATLPVGDPRKDGVLVGPLIDEAAVKGFEAALSDAVAQGGEIVVGGGPDRGRRRLRHARHRAHAGPDSGGRARDLRPHPLCPDLERFRSGGRASERRAAGPVVPASSPTACARPRPFCRPGARTAASPTSTSAPRAPRSAGRSAARRRPAADARAARTPGRPICAARPRR